MWVYTFRELKTNWALWHSVNLETIEQYVELFSKKICFFLAQKKLE